VIPSHQNGSCSERSRPHTATVYKVPVIGNGYYSLHPNPDLLTLEQGHEHVVECTPGNETP